MMDNKRKYTQFCQSARLPLHMQPWWLDAVCTGGSWDVSLAFDAEGRICGALPYYLTRAFGLQFIKMPPLTDYIGPWIQPAENRIAKQERLYAYEKQVITDLVEGLPNVHFFNQQYYSSFTNWLPFYWKGYRQTTYYTYIIDNLTNLDAIYEGFKNTVRTDIKKAENQVNIVTGDNPGPIYQLHPQRDFAVSREVFNRLDQALAQRNQRRIFLAQDYHTGEDIAGLYVTWDHHTAYFMLAAIKETRRQSAALHLLYWEAIRQMAGLVQQIDLCGSILPGPERFSRSLGARQAPHFRVYKTGNNFLKIISLLLKKGYD